MNPQEAMQRSWRDETHSETQKAEARRKMAALSRCIHGQNGKEEGDGRHGKSYERGRQAWTWAYVRGVHGMTRLSKRNEVLA